jgi:hypothetical protein
MLQDLIFCHWGLMWGECCAQVTNSRNKAGLCQEAAFPKVESEGMASVKLEED